MKYVRSHGIDQFLKLYHELKEIGGDKLFYGDEIEYGIFKVSKSKKTLQLSLRGQEIMNTLNQNETKEGRALPSGKCDWVPEYGAWMIEATPSEPYGGFASDLLRVEANMRARRTRLQHALKPGEIAPTVVAFPLMGVGDFTGTGAPVRGPAANSRFVPDCIINPHPRFATLTANIRKRRGRNVKVMAPLFQDTHTDNTPEEGAEGTPGIYMDAMGFGMGMCCLQVTFQARDVAESRHLYDALAVLAPLFQALTAATPIMKGKLADWDARWNYIQDSVDCRTAEESGEADGTNPASVGVASKSDADFTATPEQKARYAGAGVKRINKSRYSTIDMYLCNHLNGEDCKSASANFNDLEVQYDEECYARLLEGGADPLLAKHVAHLFVRDPLVLFEGKIKELDDTVALDHFENLQSTNWNSVRWKPPPRPDGPVNARSIGWRTEFRSMDIQLTDFENAAFTVFITLASRVLLSFNLNTYIPVTKSDENMARAHLRDAVTSQKFWFRSHLVDPSDHDCPHIKSGRSCQLHGDHDHCEEMTILEFMTGKGSHFPGFVPLIMAYSYQMGFDQETMDKVQGYMDFIVKRASGETMTTAKWMRQFVTTHKDYKHDSIVSESIAHDLMVRCNDIGLGKVPCPEVLGDVRITAISRDAAYNVELGGVSMTDSKVHLLLQRYALRAEKIRRQKQLAQEIVAKEAELVALKAEFEDIMVDDPTDEARQSSFVEAGKADAVTAGGGIGHGHGGRISYGRTRTDSTTSIGSGVEVDGRPRSGSSAYLKAMLHGHSHSNSAGGGSAASDGPPAN